MNHRVLVQGRTFVLETFEPSTSDWSPWGEWKTWRTAKKWAARARKICADGKLIRIAVRDNGQTVSVSSF